MFSESEDWKPLIAGFVITHTHDLRNDLNGLSLEASALGEMTSDAEAVEAIGRIRVQIQQMANRLRTLAGNFEDVRPRLASVAAGELFQIWRDQAAELGFNEIEWKNFASSQELEVDVQCIVNVLRELLLNAIQFSDAGPMRAALKVDRNIVTFELCEPKSAPLQPDRWGRVPFLTTARGKLGLGLWQSQRIIQAHSGKLVQQFFPEEKELVTRLDLPCSLGSS